MIENSTPETIGTLRVRYADLLDVQRQHRTEAAIDELQAEDHDHHQDEVLEREHVAERDAAAVSEPRLGRSRARAMRAARRTCTCTSTSPAA